MKANNLYFNETDQVLSAKMAKCPLDSSQYCVRNIVSPIYLSSLLVNQYGEAFSVKSYQDPDCFAGGVCLLWGGSWAALHRSAAALPLF